MSNSVVFMMKTTAREQLRSKAALYLDLLTSITYATVFLLQIQLIYRINPHGFVNLSKPFFLVALFSSQIIVFLGFDTSTKKLAESVIDGQFDITLLRPVNIFVYKYIRYANIGQFIMICLFLCGLTISIVRANLDVLITIKILFFILCASLIKINTLAAGYSIAFFTRNIVIVKRLRTLEELTQNKPADIFPGFMKFILTYVLPFIVIQCFIFDLVRGFDTTRFWVITIVWLTLSILLNKFLWSLGLKKYESIG